MNEICKFLVLYFYFVCNKYTKIEKKNKSKTEGPNYKPQSHQDTMSKKEATEWQLKRHLHLNEEALKTKSVVKYV